MSDNRLDEFIEEFLEEFLERFKKATGLDLKSGELKWENPEICYVCPSKNCADCFTKNHLEPDIPKKIQGYTAEQWQEIIDGGYLCEFSDNAGYDQAGNPEINTLKSAWQDDPLIFNSTNGLDYRFCRPAQIKGVMRPIFVEPVDKGRFFHFFDMNGNRVSGGSWPYHVDDTKIIKKYIEV